MMLLLCLFVSYTNAASGKEEFMRYPFGYLLPSAARVEWIPSHVYHLASLPSWSGGMRYVELDPCGTYVTTLT
ncbi:hypothetical protein EUGRSUZ_H01967 [Eucalyptus grandis]|uniref:Uncharacterized protein n=2 Tax=Eucalyptus grandis TaxID=71139 RepID=A0ACC3JQ57_EUCGR|nr:hypothetical protein EUGRSUZ_H01967 [Eucalyptus grandis]